MIAVILYARKAGRRDAVKKSREARLEQGRQEQRQRDDLRQQRHSAVKEAVRRKDANELFSEYDVNRSGKLERSEVIALIRDTDLSTPCGTTPPDGLVDFALKAVCMKRHGCDVMNSPICKCEKLDAIELNDMPELLASWSALVDQRQEFEEKLALYYYDTSKEDKLSKAEVKDYLIDLNYGNRVTNEELDAIFSKADVLGDGYLNVFELQRAASLWYAHAQSRPKRPKSQLNCCCLRFLRRTKHSASPTPKEGGGKDESLQEIAIRIRSGNSDVTAEDLASSAGSLTSGKGTSVSELHAISSENTAEKLVTEQEVLVQKLLEETFAEEHVFDERRSAELSMVQRQASRDTKVTVVTI